MFARIAPRGMRAVLLAAGAAVATLSVNALATTDIITSGNSSLTYNLTVPPGNNNWTVDGVNEFGPLAGQQWFWTSVNGSSTASLDSLSLISNTTTSNTLTAVYAPVAIAAAVNNAQVAALPAYTITLTSILTGGASGSGASAINTTLAFNNLTDTAMNSSLYMYVNLEVNGSANDLLVASGPSHNTMTQTDPTGVSANVAVTPPSEYQVANDGSILSTLDAGGGVVLSDNYTSPLSGNDSFAFEWDDVVGAGSTELLSINETITPSTATPTVVPAPNAAYSALATLAGLAGIAIVRRVRRKMA